MASIEPTRLLTYLPQEHIQNKVSQRTYKLYLESFKAQLNDNYLSVFTIRALVLSGANPTPVNGAGMPLPFTGTRAEFLDGKRKGDKRTARETIHDMMNQANYNGLLPYNKALDQIAEQKTFFATNLDGKNEGIGSTCVGMSQAILKRLKEEYNIEAMFAAERPEGARSFTHAALIVQCCDGYVFIDPRDNPKHRIFSLKFNETLTNGNIKFIAGGPGSTIPIKLVTPDITYEYCTNIENGDDLVLKHFIVEAPFEGPNTSPGFPISAWKPTGGASKTIWVSPIHGKLTLKNMTLKKDDPERTVVISFQTIRERELTLLNRFYQNGYPNFKIPQKELEKELVKFIDHAEIINRIFFDVYVPDWQ